LADGFRLDRWGGALNQFDGDFHSLVGALILVGQQAERVGDRSQCIDLIDDLAYAIGSDLRTKVLNRHVGAAVEEQ
jgi:hypothetical protein